MIKKLDITGIRFDVTEELKDYITAKIGKLDKYMPKAAARTVRCEVRLTEETKGANKYCAEVLLNFKDGQINAKETAATMYAAVDLVEQKVKNQIKKDHDKKVDHTSDRKGYLAKVRALADRDFRGKQN